MAKQLTLFSCIKKENAPMIIRDVLKTVVDQVVLNEKNEGKKTSDYKMTSEKLQLWPKDDAFQFWDKNLEKSISWIEIDAEKETFTCWVCRKYPGVANEHNKVTEGCRMWHRNYLTRHKNDESHKVIIFDIHILEWLKRVGSFINDLKVKALMIFKKKCHRNY